MLKVLPTKTLLKEKLTTEILSKKDKVLLLNPSEIIIDSKVIDLDENTKSHFKAIVIGISGALVLHISNIADALINSNVIIPIATYVKDTLAYLNAPFLPGIYTGMTNFHSLALAGAWLVASSMHYMKMENAKREKAGKPKVQSMWDKKPVITEAILIILAVILLFAFA